MKTLLKPLRRAAALILALVLCLGTFFSLTSCSPKEPTEYPNLRNGQTAEFSAKENAVYFITHAFGGKVFCYDVETEERSPIEGNFYAKSLFLHGESLYITTIDGEVFRYSTKTAELAPVTRGIDAWLVTPSKIYGVPYSEERIAPTVFLEYDLKTGETTEVCELEGREVFIITRAFRDGKFYATEFEANGVLLCFLSPDGTLETLSVQYNTYAMDNDNYYIRTPYETLKVPKSDPHAEPELAFKGQLLGLDSTRIFYDTYENGAHILHMIENGEDIVLLEPFTYTEIGAQLQIMGDWLFFRSRYMIKEPNTLAEEQTPVGARIARPQTLSVSTPQNLASPQTLSGPPVYHYLFNIKTGELRMVLSAIY